MILTWFLFFEKEGNEFRSLLEEHLCRWRWDVRMACQAWSRRKRHRMWKFSHSLIKKADACRCTSFFHPSSSLSQLGMDYSSNSRPYGVNLQYSWKIQCFGMFIWMFNTNVCLIWWCRHVARIVPRATTFLGFTRFWIHTRVNTRGPVEAFDTTTSLILMTASSFPDFFKFLVISGKLCLVYSYSRSSKGVVRPFTGRAEHEPVKVPICLQKHNHLSPYAGSWDKPDKGSSMSTETSRFGVSSLPHRTLLPKDIHPFLVIILLFPQLYMLSSALPPAYIRCISIPLLPYVGWEQRHRHLLSRYSFQISQCIES